MTKAHALKYSKSPKLFRRKLNFTVHSYNWARQDQNNVVPWLQNIPPHPCWQLHCQGSLQVPWTQPGYFTHSSHRAPVQPARHLNAIRNHSVARRQLVLLHKSSTIYYKDSFCQRSACLSVCLSHSRVIKLAAQPSSQSIPVSSNDITRNFRETKPSRFRT